MRDKLKIFEQILAEIGALKISNQNMVLEELNKNLNPNMTGKELALYLYSIKDKGYIDARQESGYSKDYIEKNPRHIISLESIKLTTKGKVAVLNVDYIIDDRSEFQFLPLIDEIQKKKQKELESQILKIIAKLPYYNENHIKDNLDVKNIEFETSAIIYLIRYYLDNLKKDNLIDFKLDDDDQGEHVYHYHIHLIEK